MGPSPHTMSSDANGLVTVADFAKSGDAGYTENWTSNGVPERMKFASSQLRVELERHVNARTNRRVRNLTIEVVPEAVILRGHASTYYVKQLAQHGVRDLLPQTPLQNAIVVDGVN